MNKFFKRRRRLFRGQSIVEFTLLLPLLLMLLSSLIEFGFMLNEYLDLIDTTRETARYLSDLDPFSTTAYGFREEFYEEGHDEMANTLSRAGWIHLNESTDDLVISIFAITGNTSIARYPTEFGEAGWQLYGNKASKFSSNDILTRFSSGTSATPPNNGIVLVEIFYDYQMRLGLPWVTGIIGDTIGLHAYSFAPNPFAEP
jgi:hypothetical protein